MSKNPMATPRTRVPMSAVHVPALDGLRGVAILLVMLSHFVTSARMTPLSDTEGWVYYQIGIGRIGVDLFFVLSGFLITGILLDSAHGERYFRNFYIRRVLRIFPLYYGFLALWLLVLPLYYTWPNEYLSYSASPLWAWGYLTNISQSIHDHLQAAWPYTGHFWSLAIEEQFYLVWPVVVFLCSRRNLMLTCLALMTISPTVRMMLAWDERCTTADVLTFARMDTLAMGALIAVAVRRSGGLQLPVSVPPLLVVGGTVAFFGLEWFPTSGHCGEQGLAMAGFFHGAFAVIFGAMLITAIDRRHTTSERWFSNSTLRFFGRYSYGLYVFHLPMMYFIEEYVFRVDTAPVVLGTRALGLLVSMAINVTASVAVAFISWHLYEKQFLRLKDRFAYKPASPAAEERPGVAMEVAGSLREHGDAGG